MKFSFFFGITGLFFISMTRSKHFLVELKDEKAENKNEMEGGRMDKLDGDMMGGDMVEGMGGKWMSHSHITLPGKDDFMNCKHLSFDISLFLNEMKL